MKVQLRKRILAAGLTVMMSGSVIAMDAMPVFAEEQTNAVLAEEANLDGVIEQSAVSEERANPSEEIPQILNGWVKKEEGWYYYKNGVMLTGWQVVNGTWYYMEENGLMASDTWIGDYYVDASGAWITHYRPAQWINTGGRWWYRNVDGSYPVRTWKLIEEKWYYFDAAGYMVTGWQNIGGAWYYLDGSGAMATDWLPSSEGWYYLGGDGAMKTGWQWIDNHWYYFYTENDPLGGTTGVMAVNTMVDGWTITSNGIAVNGLEGKFEEIKKYVYVPYRYGGTTPSGWDCSGFTQWALHYIGGITIPRTTYLQAVGGVNIDKNNRNLWKPGDILVYQSGSGFSHVALYLGDGMLMHALNTKYGTLIQGVDYYEQWDRGNHLALVRRYL